MPYKVECVEDIASYIRLVADDDRSMKQLRGVYIKATQVLKVKAYPPYHHLEPLIEGMKKFLKYKNYEVKKVVYY